MTKSSASSGADSRTLVVASVGLSRSPAAAPDASTPTESGEQHEQDGTDAERDRSDRGYFASSCGRAARGGRHRVGQALMSRKPTPRPPRSAVITAEGKRRLQEEYDRLWSVERPAVTHEVSEAAALGDRSENAEYIYGKRRLREIDQRLEFLNRRLEELVVVEPEERDDGRVTFGAWVELEDVDGVVVEYRLVGPDEFDVESGSISVDSPVGKALLGRTCGDEVVVRRPRGDAVFEITGVRYRR